MSVVEPEVKCHGEFWDYPKAEECKACPGQQSCFHRFSQVTFPKMQETLGPGATLSQLAKALDVSEEAVLVAKNAQAAPFQVPEAPAVPDIEPEEIEKAEEAEELEETAEEEEAEQLGLVEELGEGEPEELNLVDADEMEDELRASSEPEPEPEPPPELEMATSKKKASKKAPAKKKKAASKKAASKKAASKKAPAKKKKAAKAPPPVSSEVQNPSPAESVQTAKGSAGKKARAKNAPRAKGPAGPVKSGDDKKGKQRKRQVVAGDNGELAADPWGRHTWEDRYLRERRNKLISQLRPGMKLRREYKGEIHEVSVLKMFYRYKGELWPTLYTITKEITGTQEAPRQITKQGRRPAGTRQLCAWSAPKFFGLQALFNKS